jgi:hypothetical protein
MTSKPHPHAALMRQYADDAAETNTPWERWEWKGEMNGPDWHPCLENPIWAPDYTYRRKPRTININGIEVPEPVREPLVRDQVFYCPSVLDGASGVFFWKNDPWHQGVLDSGLVHLTAKAAVTHAKALRSFTQTEEAAQ